MQNLKYNRYLGKIIENTPRGPKSYRPKESYNDILFEFNPYDDDDHPSVPHGDSLDHRYKIDLRSGDLYEGRELTGHLKKKEFERLKRDKRIQKIIRTAQAYYREHHPEISFDPIPWCDKAVKAGTFRCKKVAIPIFKLRVEFD